MYVYAIGGEMRGIIRLIMTVTRCISKFHYDTITISIFVFEMCVEYHNMNNYHSFLNELKTQSSELLFIS